ncbi:hypothetical protein PLEOSDRAFT_1107859 [Pleurotus ostreatus PC15]|uniref:F-box domain-containing protein n=1 Tax=Pleurotus ostreatus (strain PC15) TaxID=1137138 RepID=A0A067NMU3_PLEO1|nr:hypothetical protein PLEOSDRAFT_1107859 [Pleurotus ostreatus PC15]
MGYRASNSPPYGKTQFELGLASPLQLSSSLFVASRRPSIPLSLKLLHFPTSPTRRTASNGHIPAPIDRLPVEILCDIFSICDETPGNQPCGSKVTLSHVCRRWRGVVLCMPVLWSRISVQKPNQTSVERVTAHFRRSGSYPISLAIIETVSASLEQRDAITCLLPMIRTHASQIKSLCLRLRTSAGDFVTHLNGCQFPRLEALECSLHRCPKDLMKSLMTRLQQGSHLSSLVWSGAEDIPPNVSWHSLTRLELRGSYNLQDVCNILGQCRDLQELILDSFKDSPVIDTSFFLPALRNLQVHSRVSLGPFFRCLHAPSLQTIFIHYRMDADLSRDWDSFGVFLLRSSCDLRSFVLWDVRIDDVQFAQCLELPGLQSLTTIDVRQPISDNILRRITLSNSVDRVALLPRLESVTLSRCLTVDGLLQDFVSSRLAHGRLNSFKVGLGEGQSKDEIYLRSLKEAGRNIYAYR